MFKKVAFWMGALGLVFFAVSVGVPNDGATGNEPQFSRQKDDADVMLGRLESLVNNVDSRKIITIEDDADINRLLDECPEKLNDLDEEASKNQQLKQEFGQFLTDHQRRVKALHSKLTSIESQAKVAKIVPDRSLLLSFSSAELQKYKSFLSSEGLSRVKQMYPEIFNKQPDPEPPSEAAGMISGPNLDPWSGEHDGALSVSSAAAKDCYGPYYHCKDDCASAAIKWACKANCWLKYIACIFSQYF